MPIVLSGYHIREILSSSLNQPLVVSLDLGLSQSEIMITETLQFPDGQELSREKLERNFKKKKLTDCFLIDNNELFFLSTFNHETNTSYKLYEPQIDWPPTLSINGSFMHTIVTATPLEEATHKVNALDPTFGIVLETCMGLGYCTKMMLKTVVDKIITCEISEEVIHLAKINPWSKDIFYHKRIEINHIDVSKYVHKKESEFVNFILHDPPTLHRVGELYSEGFYSQLYRILKKKGKLYHYIGTETEKTKHRYKKGVINRLYSAGFSRVESSYRGVVAYK
ncbi:MAG TPA: SAM-dependent methyltransferase [Candidatus Bathyarchaeia archaeon]|nr:SAM-dependent methyltransferase [Candidatus Bathyarchaeia archaeon]